MHLKIPHNIIKKTAASIVLAAGFLMLSTTSAQAQEIIINKVAVENGTICNQFDVTLEIIGDPPPRPQEVVLIIDRSGSMDDGPVPEPIDFAQEAAIDFIGNFFDPANNPTGLNKIAIVSYAASATLDQGLTDSSGEASLIATVNAIATGGPTNIAQAIQAADNELINNGSFDCATSRSIILLTDGVPTRNAGGGSCNDTTDPTTSCIDDAIDAGVAAQTTTVGGEVYDTSVFTIGLVGAISGATQTIALSTLDAIQDSGAFFTEDNADLTAIYDVILGQLVAAATQLPGQSLVTDEIGGSFSFVPGSFVASKGTAEIAGQTVSWFVDSVTDETITLSYSMIANPDVCGDNTAGVAVINYENSSCAVDEDIFNNPTVCVPCPEVTATIERDGCTNTILFTGTLSQGDCDSLDDDFEWEFFLNGVSVGFANTLSGSFEYTGTDPFEGDFSAELTYNGTYGSGCVLPAIVADDSLVIPSPPTVSTVITDVACFGAATGAIDVTVSGGTPPYTYVWNTGEITEDLSGLTAGTYEVTVTDADGCIPITTTAVVVQQPDMDIEITGVVTDVLCFGDDTGAIDVTVTGGTPPYTYSWSPGGASTEDIDTLVAGTYELTVTDDNGCASGVESFTVDQPLAALEANISAQTDIVCNTTLGSVTVVATEGTGPYRYSLDGGAFVSSGVFTDLAAGDYIVDVEDSNGCTTSVPVSILNSCIAIVKTGNVVDLDGDNCADDGETINYTFIVTNQGNTPISGVTVTDLLVGTITFNSGDTNGNNILDVSEAWDYQAVYTITQDDIDAGQVINQATASGTTSVDAVTDLSDDTSELEDDPTVTELCQGAEIAIVKTGVFVDGNGDNCADDGESIDYTFTVTNQGNVSLASISVTDPLVTPITYVSGDTDVDGELDVDESWTYTGSYIITQDDIDAGEVTNQAVAQGTAPDASVVDDLSDDTSVLENDPTDTILCQDPAIAIVKTGVFVDGNGDNCADDGESIDYTFTVTNQGNVSLASISVTDPLVAPITYVSGDTDLDGELDVTETWIYTGSYTITQDDIDAGQVTNQATAEGTAPDASVVDDLSDDTSVLENDPTVTPLCNDAAIAIVKTGVFVDGNGDDCADDGESIDYTFTVTNQGNVSLASISVTDPLVAPITYVSGDTDVDGELDVTETWIYTGSYTITQDDIDAGQVTNQATAEGTAPDASVVDDLSDDTSVLENDPTVTPLCNDAAIAIVKTGVFVDGNGDNCADDGESIDYTFTVTNQGNVSLASISVTDPLVTPITYVSGDTDVDGELDVTETWIYTGSYTITQDDIDAGQVTNQATAEGTAPDASVVDDLSDDASALENDPTVTPLCNDAAIAIVKTGVFLDLNGDNCANEGEGIEYTFTVTNQGNVSLASIIVTDPLVGIVTYVSGDTDVDGELDVTETWIYNGSYALTQDDIDAGQVTNQATAEGTAPDASVVDDLSDDTSVLENDPTVTDLCQDPAIAIVKTGVFVDGNGDDCADDGESIDYTFTVFNQGNVSLASISVTDPLVAPITYVSGDTDVDGELDVTETWIYTGSYTITQDDIDAGQVTNQATAEGTAPDASVVDDLSDDASVLENDPTVTPLCNGAAIAIVKTGVFVDGNGDNCADDGESIDYTFTVTNQGNVSLASISVTDPLVTPITYVSGDTDVDGELDVTETWIYTGSYTITQDDIDAGQVTNQATAEGTAPDASVVDDLSDDTSVIEDDPTVTPLCQQASIAILKVGVFNDINNNICADDGDAINYTFTVINTGNVSLDNITVTDPLVAAIVFDGVDIGLAGVLDVGESWTYTAEYAISATDITAESVSNQARVSGETLGTDLPLFDDSHPTGILLDAPTVTTFNACPVIIAVDDSAGPIAGVNVVVPNVLNVFDNDTFNGVLLNPTDVILSETIPEPDGYLILNSDGSVDVAADTPPGVYQLTYQICSVVYPAVCDTAVVTVTVVEPEIVLIAEGICINDAAYLDYEITLLNFNLDPDEVTIEWSDSSGTVIQIDLDNATSSINGLGQEVLTGQVLWPGMVLDGSGIAIDWPGWIYDGFQWVEGIDGFETLRPNATVALTVNPTATTVVTYPPADPFCVPRPPGIAVIKSTTFSSTDTAGNCIVQEGDVINYTFSVQNIGSGDLTNVIVTDPGATVVGGPIILAVGETNNTAFTATYTVTQDDIDAGFFSNQATVTGTPVSGPNVSDLSDDDSFLENDPTVTSLCKDSVIAIVKTGVFVDGNGDNCADDGESIDYTFVVTNEGNESLSTISVTDPLVGTITFVDGDTDGDTELDPDETWIYTGSYTITQDDIDAGQVTNQATATALDTNDNAVSDLSDDTSVLENDPTVTDLCQDPAIAIIKTGVFVDGNGDDCADDGESIDYTFTVTNQGNVSLASISVTDPLVAPITYVSGDTDLDGELDVTETWIYTGSYTITQDDIDAGQVTNQATAEGTAPDASVVDDLSDDTSVLENDPTVTPLCNDAAIAIVKTGVFVDGNGDDCADDGESIDYTFTVTNQGNVSLASISVTDPLVAPITYVSGDTDVDGELDVTETWIYTGSYTITQDDIDAGQVTNQATAEGTAPDASVVDDLSDDTSVLENDPTVTDLCQDPAIAIIKTGLFVDGNGDNCADDGESIDYTFTVTNQGNVSLASISVTDPLVAPITYVSGDTDLDGELDVTETWIYTGSYTITQDDIDAGQVTNQATAEGTAPDASVVDDLSDDASVLENDPTVTPLCNGAAIAIVKTGVFVDGNGDNCADDGESIDYTFTVTNQGNVSLASISVTDPLVAPITYVSGDTDLDGELDVTETWIYTGSYTITQDDIDAGQVTNQATAEGTAPDASVVDDLSDDTSVLENDPTVTPLCNDAAIAIVKTGVFVDGNGDNCADDGESIDYTFTVTNQGNVSLASISVTDPLVTPITYVSGDTDVDGELDVTETWIYTGSYTITQDDIDAGQVTNQATAEGTAPDASVVDDLSDDASALENDPTVTPLCNDAAIAIVKTGVFLDLNGDNCANEGEGIEYTFTVTNQGNVSLASIIVTDPLVAPITYVSGDTDVDGELDVTETWIYTGSYTITQDDIDAGQVTNQATAEGTAPDASVVDDLSDDTSVLENDPTVTPLCNDAAIAIVKTGVFVDGNGDNCADDGESIDYTFTVTNQGNVSLASISVTDPLVAPITYVSGDTDVDGELDVTETWIYTGSYTITQDDIDAGQVTNQATAEGTAPDASVVDDLSDDTSVLENDPTVTPLCNDAAIAIVKTGVFVDGNGDNCADDGESIDYTFTVTNQGNVSLASISVTDPLVAPITYVSGDTDVDGELDVTETWIYTGSYTITQDDIDAGQVTNQATAEGTAPDASVVDDLSDDTSVLENDPTVTPLCNDAAIAIVKTGVFVDGNGDNCADDGESIDYTFTVTNQGNVSLASISVTDPLVAPITYVSGDTDVDGELDVTETWIYTGSYTITQDDIDAGQVTNQATAEGTAPDASVVDDLSDDTSVLENDPTVTPLCNDAAIAIVKTGVFVDGNGDDCADDGESIDYTFTVTNQGNVSLASISVTDPLVAPITYVSGDTDLDGELDVTETWIYTGSYTITQDDIDAGQVTNQATAEGTAPDASVVDDLSDDTSVLENDPTVTDLCQDPAIAIVKTGVFVDGNGDDCADDGETIEYTFTVTNEGNVSLSGVVVTDPLVGTITFVGGDTDLDGELDVDETWTYTATYTITQDDIDAGQVTNQATAEGTAPDASVVDDLSDDTSVLENDPTITELCQDPAIAIIKTGLFVDGNGDDCADDGETIEYTFTVTNEGNVSLSGVVVTDPLVGTITFVGGDTDGDGELDVDETWTYTATYTITQDDIDAGEVVNQATADGTAPDGTVVSDLSDNDTVVEDDPTITELCQDPAIAIIKTGLFVDGNGDDCADDGETIEYTFTVTNEGNVSLSGVVVTDPLVGTITFVGGDTDGDGELDVDETWTYTATYTITQDDIDAGEVVNQATADGTAPDGTVVSDLSDNDTVVEDDPTITELCQDPAIAIIKTGLFVDGNGDDCADDGETIEYTFTVTNEGNVSLSGVVVTDPLVGTITFVGGDTDGDGELDVDETWTYTATYTITQDDIDAGEVVNQATADGTAPDGTVVSDLSDNDTVVEDDPTITELCQDPAIAIIKTGLFVDGNGDDCADDGETIEYTFTVTNEGNVSLSGVVVTDPLVGTITFVGGDTDGDGELDVDETWTYTATYTITQDDIDAGEVVNQATADGTAPDGTVVSDLSDNDTVVEDDPTITELCQDPAIAIIKTGLFVDGNGDDCADDGETIEYTFTVTNEGNVSLSGVVVTDPLVGTITFVGGDTDGDGELDVDETWTYTATYTITQDDIDAGEVVNQATADGTAPDGTVVSDLSDNDTVVEDDPTITELCQDPAIAIIKTGLFVDGNGDDCADDGETIEYTFTVTNEGNVSLSGVVVTDPLVGTITFVGGDTDGDGELDVDETWTYTATYTITQDDIDAGEVVNQATADGTAPDGTVVSDLSDNDTVVEDDPTITELCQDPAIAIIKTGLFVDGNGDDCADDGETIEYTFTVTNEGNVSLSGVVVTDPLVGTITFVGGDTDGDGELDVDETWTYTATYTITQDDIDAGEVVNQATADGTAPDGTVVSDLSDNDTVVEDDPTITELCQDPAIAIIKTGLFVDGNGDDCADDGETIEYTFTVTNEGNVSLSGVVVTDPLVGTITFVGGDTDGDGELDVDETWTYTATYTITQDDIDAGEVVNQATADGTAPDGTVVSDLSDNDTVVEDDPTITELCQDPAIAIIKTGLFVDGNGDDCADDGETIEYTFTVTNEGNVSLSGVVVTDPLVGTITFVGGDTDGDGELDVDETWTYTATYTITQDDIDAGEVVNQATADGTAPDGTVVSDLSDNDTVVEDDPTITELCQDPAIAILKTGVFVDGDGSGCTEEGESIDYTFTVVNTGNVSLADVVVMDPLLGGVIAGPDSGDTDGDGELDVDETWIYSASYMVTLDDVNNGFVINQAEVMAVAPDGTDVSDLSDESSLLEDDPTETELCQSGSISVEKTGIFNDINNDGEPQVGETITYAFTVYNTGNVTVFDIVITDPLVEVSGGPITLAPGEFDDSSFTAVYVLTEADIEAGEVVNQAIGLGMDINGNDIEDESDDPNDPTDVDNNGDGEPDDPTVVILPEVEAAEFEIFNGITPDGDGRNDFFRIQGIENFQDNNMQIFNRWGVLVYETDGYGGADGLTNVFTGLSEGRVTIRESKLLPTGTYYYVLRRFTGGETLENAGYLYINRK